MKNIFAYTEEGFSPSFISVNTDDEQKHSVSVRSSGDSGTISAVELTQAQLISLADSIYDNFAKG